MRLVSITFPFLLGLVAGCSTPTHPADLDAAPPMPDAGDEGVDACVPTACQAEQCGLVADGCGGTQQCGDCPCVGEAEAVLCEGAGLVECGTATVVDRCGASRTLDCGTCDGDEACGAWTYGVCHETACSDDDWCRPLGPTLAEGLAVRGLSGDGSGRVWAAASAADAGILLEYTGQGWTTLAAGPHPLRAVGGEGDQVWCSDADGDVVEPDQGELGVVDASTNTWTSMAVIDEADVWVAGHFGSGAGAFARATHFDGATWTDHSFGPALDPGWHWFGASAAASDAVWLVGATVPNGGIDAVVGPLIGAYDGVAWTILRDELPTNSYLRAVWAHSPTDVWAVGDAGTILHFDGGAWTSSDSGVSTRLLAVTGTGTNVWAAGEQGVVLRRVGNAWVPQGTGTTKTIRSLFASSATDVWAGGDDGLLLHYRP